MEEAHATCLLCHPPTTTRRPADNTTRSVGFSRPSAPRSYEEGGFGGGGFVAKLHAHPGSWIVTLMKILIEKIVLLIGSCVLKISGKIFYVLSE